MRLPATCKGCGSTKKIHLHKKGFSYSCPVCSNKRRIFAYVLAVIGGCGLIPWASNYADKVRGYDGVGGEFLIALVPILIVAFIDTFKDL